MSIYLPIAELSLDLTLLLTMGLGVGILSGLFGIGGGFILTPALMVLGVPSAVAVGTGASQVVASSVSGALGHWRKNNVDVKLGSLLILGGLCGSVSGVKLQQWLKALGQLDLVTSAVYVVMLSVVGSMMLIESVRTMRGAVASTGRRRGGQHTFLERLPFKMRFRTSKLFASALPPIGMGFLIGMLTAIMGVGGGFLLIPLLIYVQRLPTRLAMGTSAFQIIFVTAVTTVLQAVNNQSVDLMLAAPLIIGGVTGAQMGVRLGSHLKAEQLRFLLAGLVLAVAVRMALDLTQTPQDVFVLQRLN